MNSTQLLMINTRTGVITFFDNSQKIIGTLDFDRNPAFIGDVDESAMCFFRALEIIQPTTIRAKCDRLWKALKDAAEYSCCEHHGSGPVPCGDCASCIARKAVEGENT